MVLITIEFKKNLDASIPVVLMIRGTYSSKGNQNGATDYISKPLIKMKFCWLSPMH
jgi:hypothetical protein